MKNANKQYMDNVVAMRLKPFKAELKALLEKYSACIGGSYSGDTHGIDEEKFVVSFKCPKLDRHTYSLDTEDITLSDNGTYITASDLED